MWLNGDFPSGPVVNKPPCNAGNMASIPGWGTKISHATEQQSSMTATSVPMCRNQSPHAMTEDRLCHSRARAGWRKGTFLLVRTDKTWSTGEGNGRPLQYSCLENPRITIKKAKRPDTAKYINAFRKVCRNV